MVPWRDGKVLARLVLMPNLQGIETVAEMVFRGARLSITFNEQLEGLEYVVRCGARSQKARKEQRWPRPGQPISSQVRCHLSYAFDRVANPFGRFFPLVFQKVSSAASSSPNHCSAASLEFLFYHWHKTAGIKTQNIAYLRPLRDISILGTTFRKEPLASLEAARRIRQCLGRSITAETQVASDIPPDWHDACFLLSVAELKACQTEAT